MAIVNYTEHSIAAKQSLKEMQCEMEVRDYDTALANAYSISSILVGAWL